MSEVLEGMDPRCPTCGQPLRHDGQISRENASFITASGNAGITFETQGRCENDAGVDFGGEFAQMSRSTLPTERIDRGKSLLLP